MIIQKQDKSTHTKVCVWILILDWFVSVRKFCTGFKWNTISISLPRRWPFTYKVVFAFSYWAVHTMHMGNKEDNMCLFKIKGLSITLAGNQNIRRGKRNWTQNPSKTKTQIIFLNTQKIQTEPSQNILCTCRDSWRDEWTLFVKL